MAPVQRPAPACSGLVDHCLNRAVARLVLFEKPEDYAACEHVLVEAVPKHPVRIRPSCPMVKHWHFALWPAKNRRYNCGMRRSAHRVIDIIVGIPFLVLGACGIVIDIASLVYYATPRPNEHSTVTFPAGMIFGIPFFWFGCHLVFRRGNKPIATNPDPPENSKRSAPNRPTPQDEP